jgi:histidinol phosphatase-like enzyme
VGRRINDLELQQSVATKTQAVVGRRINDLELEQSVATKTQAVVGRRINDLELQPNRGISSLPPLIPLLAIAARPLFGSFSFPVSDPPMLTLTA